MRWTGPFAPAYRVLPKWRISGDALQEFNVLLYRGADTLAAAQAIGALAGQVGEVVVLDGVLETVKATLTADALLASARIPGVYSIQPVPTDGGLGGEMSDQVNVNEVDQNNLAFPGYLGWLAGVNLDGSGVIMANVDGGIENTHPDLVNRLIPCTVFPCFDFTSDHGTQTAGIMAGDGSSGVVDSFGFLRGLGVAPGANLLEQFVGSGSHNVVDMMRLRMMISSRNGASLSSNSWTPSSTPDGYDAYAREVDFGVRDADAFTAGNQPLTYVQIMGNGEGGTSTQWAPADAKNIFTIGSTKMQTSSGTQILAIDDLSSNTSHGPARDGRTIPHMVAPGCYVDSCLTNGAHGLGCGTSFACPQVAGAIALFIEYYRRLAGVSGDPSPALIKAAFTPVAHDLAGNFDANGVLVLGHPFDSKQGWGRMNIEAVVDPQVSVRYFDQSVVFDNTGEQWETNLAPSHPAQAMRFMLVWTDAPGSGSGGASTGWVNDLDLSVEVGANTYRGNNFGGDGWSQTGGAADFMNNTEGVFLSPPGAVTVTVRVLASVIAGDGIPNQGDPFDQDFALVCYNCSEDCNANGIPDQQDITTSYACDDSLSRIRRNVLRFQFACPITLPLAGEVEIRELLAGGALGSDLSDRFDFTLEGTAGFETILRIEEDGCRGGTCDFGTPSVCAGGQDDGVDCGQVFVNETWYAVLNSGNWAGVADFKVDYASVYGDADNTHTTDFADLDAIYNVIISTPPDCSDDSRFDINTFGCVGFTDLQAAFNNIDSTAPAKPTGHDCPGSSQQSQSGGSESETSSNLAVSATLDTTESLTTAEGGSQATFVAWLPDFMSKLEVPESQVRDSLDRLLRVLVAWAVENLTTNQRDTVASALTAPSRTFADPIVADKAQDMADVIAP